MTWQPDWQYLREILDLEHQQIRSCLEAGDSAGAERHLETCQEILVRLHLIVENLPDRRDID